MPINRFDCQDCDIKVGNKLCGVHFSSSPLIRLFTDVAQIARMVVIKQLVIAVFLCLFFLSSFTDNSDAMPMGGHGHGGHGGIAEILAAGLILSLLQHHH